METLGGRGAEPGQKGPWGMTNPPGGQNLHFAEIFERLYHVVAKGHITVVKLTVVEGT